ncbi:hypothetical protein CGCVW01_v011902 [Colletotrichum viniferum]|nr:hypothetical protein CGCVW01_v011902 [Colletotrichum viniferum]
MAEVLGTVVGVVSLGLQVCSGLNVYIDGLQCHREEIESTIRHQKSLETLVAQIEGLHSRRQAPGICSAPLQESMASAKAELLLLDEFISKIRIEDVTGTERSAGNMMKIQKKRLLYPFRRDRLDRLVTRLDVVIKALQAALQVFELEASLETKDSLDQVLQTVSRSDVTMLGIERKIDENASLASHEMKASFEQVVQTVSRSEVTMLAIERKIDESTSLACVPDYATKQDVRELKKLMADLMSSSATDTFKNMVSKPSALKAICDNINHLETIRRTDGSSLTSSEAVTTARICQETNYTKYSSDFGAFKWAYRVYEENEVEEIQAEDADELALLKNLLVEFESKIDEIGCTLATFFETYWIDRMGQVLKEIQDRPILEEEVQGAERLGITLRVEEETRQEDDNQLERWFRKLDARAA